jgi:hypothetical protein
MNIELDHTNAKHIDAMLDDAEATRLDIADAINFVPFDELQTTLDLWCSKVRLNGILRITGISLAPVCGDYFLGKISSQDFANIAPSSVSLPDLTSYLESKGFKIIKKRLINYKMTVEAIREQ